MSKTPRPDERTPKIVPLVTDQEQAEVEALARYWDARQQGRTGDATQLDQGLLDIVQLLEHYRDVSGPLSSPNTSRGGVAPPSRVKPVQAAAIALVMVALLLFTSNTLLSPRSWLFSSAHDPDWIPWVSDDWLGEHAITAEIMIPGEMVKEMRLGA